MNRSSRRIALGISAADTYDGLIRVLVDMQRFGWRLDEVSAVGQGEACGEIRCIVTTPAAVSLAHIEERLARHPAIHRVEARCQDAEAAAAG